MAENMDDRAPTNAEFDGHVAHFKVLAYSPEAVPLLDKAGVAANLDDGCVELSADTLNAYIAGLSELRYWPREQAMKAP